MATPVAFSNVCYEQRRTAEGKGRVDPLLAVPGDLDHRIAWHADESRPAVGRDVGE